MVDYTNFLIFITENKFIQYKDDKWYSTLQKFNKNLGQTTYYEHEELIALYNSIFI